MVQKLNKNLVVGLTGLLFVAMTGGMVLMLLGFQPKDPTEFEKRADQALKNGNLKQAAEYFFHAYRVSNKKEPRYLVQAGDVQAEMHQEGLAIQTWKAAVQQRPDYEEAWERLVNINLEQIQDFNAAGITISVTTWQALQQYADDLLAVNAQNALAAHARGRALIELASQDETFPAQGLQSMERAVEIAPEDVEFSRQLAQRYIELAAALREPKDEAERAKKLDAADRVYQNVIKLNTEPGKAASSSRSQYALFLASQNKDADALKWFDDALKLAGDDKADIAHVQLAAASFWQVRWARTVSKPEKKAEGDAALKTTTDLLSQAEANDPDLFEPASRLANIYAYLGELDKAIGITQTRLSGRDVTRRGSKGIKSRIDRFRLLLTGSEHAITRAGRAPSDSPERAAAIGQARKFIEEAEAEFPKSGPVLYSAGKLAFIEGDTGKALELSQQADAAYGRAVWVNKKLQAALLADRQQIGAGLKAIEEAVTDPAADLSCWVLYADLLLRHQQNERALRVADVALKRFPGQTELLAAKLAAYQRLNKPDLAEVVRKEIAAATPVRGQDDQALRAEYLNISALGGAGRTDDAIKACLALLETRPKDLPAMQTLIQLYLQADRRDDAAEIVRQGMAAAPDDAWFKRVNVIIDPGLSDDQRSARMAEFFEAVPDAFDRAQQKAVWLASLKRWEDVVAALNEGIDLYAKKATPSARKADDRIIQQMLDQQFGAIETLKGDDMIARLEGVAKRAAELNIDGAEGRTYLGKVYLHQGKPDLAIDAFRKTLEVRPANSRVLAMLGRAYWMQKRTVEAEESFQKAVEMNPNDPEALMGLARLAAQMNDAEKLAVWIPVLARLFPHDPWVKQQVTELKEGDNPTEAIARREEARKSGPENISNLVKLAQLYVRTKQYDKVDACYFDAYQVEPNSAAIVMQWSKFLRGTRRASDAQRLLEKYTNEVKDPELQAFGHLMQGEFYREMGDKTRAEIAFLKAADTFPGATVFQSIARHYAVVGQFPKAAEWFTKAMAKAEADQSPLAKAMQIDLVNALLSANEKEKARQEIDKYLARYRDDALGLLVRAEIEFRTGHTDDAIRTLGLVLAKEPNNQNALASLANYQVSAGQWGLAINALETLRGVAPDAMRFEPRKLLSRCYEATNRLDLAEGELRAVLDKYPNTQDVVVALVQFYVRHVRYGDAENLVTAWINREPNRPSWYQARADLKIETKDESGALADYRKACELSQYNPEFVSRFLGVCTKFKRVDEGLQFYQEKVTDETRTPAVLLAHATLLAQKGDADGAVAGFRQALASAVAANPDAVLTAFSVAKNAQAIFGVKQAIELFRAAPAVSQDPLQQEAHQFVMAALTRMTNDLPATIEQFKALLAHSQRNFVRWNLCNELANAYETANDLENARLYYEKALELNPDSVTALNNLAFLLSDKANDPKKALPYARRAAAVRSDANVLDTLGWVYFKNERFDEAIGELSRAMVMDPDVLPACLHLGEAYRCRGDFQRAEAVLKDGLQRLSKMPYEAEYRPLFEKALERVEARDQKP